MRKQVLSEIREQLLGKKSQLEKMLSQFTTQNPDVAGDYVAKFPNYGSDDEENAMEVATFSTNLELEHELETSLRDVNKALKKIDDGTYGICKHCNQEIDIMRLKARPYSTSCINCKKKLLGEV